MITQKRLYQGQPGTASTVIYTVPAATTTVVKEILITNTTGAPVTFTLWLAPSATANAVANAVLNNVTLQGSGVFQLGSSLVCAAGETLRALQTVAGGLTFNISGYEDA